MSSLVKISKLQKELKGTTIQFRETFGFSLDHYTVFSLGLRIQDKSPQEQKSLWEAVLKIYNLELQLCQSQLGHKQMILNSLSDQYTSYRIKYENSVKELEQNFHSLVDKVKTVSDKLAQADNPTGKRILKLRIVGPKRKAENRPEVDQADGVAENPQVKRFKLRISGPKRK